MSARHLSSLDAKDLYTWQLTASLQGLGNTRGQQAGCPVPLEKFEFVMLGLMCPEHINVSIDPYWQLFEMKILLENCILGTPSSFLVRITLFLCSGRIEPSCGSGYEFPEFLAH